LNAAIKLNHFLIYTLYSKYLTTYLYLPIEDTIITKLLLYFNTLSFLSHFHLIFKLKIQKSKTMFAQSRFSMESFVSKTPMFAEVEQEYAHVCKMEQLTKYPTCVACLTRTEHEFHKRAFWQPRDECTCDELPSHTHEECKDCVAIADEIQFVRNEIVRLCTSYGIEVAQTLEINPLFSQSIERLVVRVRVMEQLLLRQQIHRNTGHVSDAESESDNMSELTLLSDDDNDIDNDDTHTHDHVDESVYEEKETDTSVIDRAANSEHGSTHAAIYPETCYAMEMEQPNAEDSDSDDFMSLANENEYVFHTPESHKVKIVGPPLPPRRRGRALALADLYEGMYNDNKENGANNDWRLTMDDLHTPLDDEVAEITRNLADLHIHETSLCAGQKRKRSDSPEPWLYNYEF
jgi:hypothetical protein